MMLCCSSPMVPGTTLTEKAERLREWGYEGMALFQPRETWDETTREELYSLDARTGARPGEFVLTDKTYGNAMSAGRELRRRCRAMYGEAAAVCAEIGAVPEHELGYGTRAALSLFEPFQQLSRQQHEAFVEFYREMLETVAGSNGRVLLEPINRYE